MTMKFTLCFVAILCALSAAALFWSGVKRQADRERERRRRKRLAVRQDREDASPVERRSSSSTRAARHLLRHRVVRAQLSPRCSRPRRPCARRARARARLHAHLCLTRAWRWHGQGALAMEEVSETSEPDLFSSDEDCSDTADVGPEGAVAARSLGSSCDSIPNIHSGHHAGQHNQTQSKRARVRWVNRDSRDSKVSMLWCVLSPRSCKPMRTHSALKTRLCVSSAIVWTQTAVGPSELSTVAGTSCCSWSTCGTMKTQSLTIPAASSSYTGTVRGVPPGHGGWSP